MMVSTTTALRRLQVLLVLLAAVVGIAAFNCFSRTSPSSKIATSSSRTSTTRLYFGIPSFLTPPQNSDDDKEKKKDDSDAPSLKKAKDKIGLSGIVQLITAGAGAPFLGDFEGVDEETGKFMFSLEANNLVDKEGRSKQTQMPYFESGWVDESDQQQGGFKFPWQK